MMAPGSLTYWSKCLRSAQKLARWHGYLQGAFNGPRERRAALCSAGRLRYGEISAVDHTHRKSHTPISLSYIHFPLLWRFHSDNDQTRLFQQLAALCSYVSTHPEAAVAGLCSLYWNTHFSHCFTFIWRSPPLDLPSFFPVLISLYPSLSPSKDVRSNKNQFYNSSSLFSGFHLHKAFARSCSKKQKCSKTLSTVDWLENNGPMSLQLPTKLRGYASVASKFFSSSSVITSLCFPHW